MKMLVRINLSRELYLPLGVGLPENFRLLEVLFVPALVPGPPLLAGRHAYVNVGRDDEPVGGAHGLQVYTQHQT